MKCSGLIIAAFLLSTVGGSAWAFDYRIDPSAPHGTPFRLNSAGKSPLVDSAGPSETLKAAIPPDYASAMTWYRMALANGFEPPLVARSLVYGDQLPEPLRWAWSSEKGDIVARTGKGSFLLAFGAGGRNWIRELNCRLVQWPDGDAQAVMHCNDGTERVMQIPEEGGVVIGNVQYRRAFQQAPVNFDLVSPEGYDPNETGQSPIE